VKKNKENEGKFNLDGLKGLLERGGKVPTGNRAADLETAKWLMSKDADYLFECDNWPSHRST